MPTVDPPSLRGEAGRLRGLTPERHGPPEATPDVTPEEVLRIALEALEIEARRLEAANAALIRANARLEDEVGSRTANLARANAALRESQEHLRLVFESATDYAIYTLDLDGRVTSWNQGARRLTGWGEAEMLGRTTEVLFTPADRAAEGLPAAAFRRVVEEGRAENERWHLRKDGSRSWASGLAMPLRDEAGRMRGFLSILRDRTEARRQEERRTLLLRELDHRVKNTLAVVQSVASQTERSTDAPASFREAFSARLMGLARAHDMLARGGWEGAPLREVIERTLEAHGGERETRRVTLDGPPVMLPPNATVTVHLGFHELATNAAKHGALRVPEGRVEVSWTLADQAGGRVLEILWRERGGPPVRVPDRRGFGSRLLEQGLAREFGGEVRLDFPPEGVACRMRLTLAAAGAGSAV